MAVITPPLFQTIDGEYSAADLGLPYRDLVSEGVIGTTGLAVSQRGAGANMSVDVAAGVAWIKGDDSSSQPTYRCVNDGTVNLTVTAADATNPRIDLVIAEVRDAAFSGVSTDWRLRVVAGTPAGSPSAPATPANSIVLARLSVPALDTTIGTAQITDYRPRAGLAGADLGPPLVTSLPTQPYNGQEVYFSAEPSTGVTWHLRYRAAASGSYKWEFIGGPPMRSEVATSQATTSTGFTNLATVGPVITTPLAGDYDIQLGGRMLSVSGQLAIMSVQWSGATAVDTDGAQLGGSASTADGHPSRTLRKTIAAAYAVTMKYRSSGGGSMTFVDRHMTLTPVRVG